MKIYKYPNRILSEVCKPVDILGKGRQEAVLFLGDMMDFFNQAPPWGAMVGLACPQVGKPWRAFIALGELYINPVSLWKPRGGTRIMKEGCYSLEEGNFNYPVERAYAITLQWQDINGEFYEKKFKRFEAQVIQHELDHLDGVCVNNPIHA